MLINYLKTFFPQKFTYSTLLSELSNATPVEHNLDIRIFSTIRIFMDVNNVLEKNN